MLDKWHRDSIITTMEEKESFKISKKLLDQVRTLKENDRGSITWHIERAITNYLIAKKVLKG